MFKKIIDVSRLKRGSKLYCLSSGHRGYGEPTRLHVRARTVLRVHGKKRDMVIVLGRDEPIDPNRFNSFLGMLMRQRTKPVGEVPFTTNERVATSKAASEMRAMAGEVFVEGNKARRASDRAFRASRSKGMRLSRMAQKLEQRAAALHQRRKPAPVEG